MKQIIIALSLSLFNLILSTVLLAGRRAANNLAPKSLLPKSLPSSPFSIKKDLVERKLGNDSFLTPFERNLFELQRIKKEKEFHQRLLRQIQSIKALAHGRSSQSVQKGLVNSSRRIKRRLKDLTEAELYLTEKTSKPTKV